MKFFKKSDVKIFSAGNGEQIAQYAGRLEKNGSTRDHSMAVMTLKPGATSQPHSHKIAEESFLIIKGSALFEIDGFKQECFPGDAVLIKAGETHTVSNKGNEILEIVICTSPAWNPEDSISPQI